VLANEQVTTDGKCERCDTVVVQRDMEQWYLKITEYADKLLEGLDRIDWPEETKKRQCDWIGRSEGAEIDFGIKNHELGIKVFTTRPDTIFGATYLVIAPEHAILKNQELGILNQEEVNSYIEATKLKTELDRQTQVEKTGVELKGVKAINPATGEEIPVWVADYVLSGYGTAAIMAVPAHDERDFEFAKKFGLPVKEVVIPIVGDKLGQTERRDVAKGVVIHDGKVLVVQESDGYYALPGGAYLDNENVGTAILRELSEEVGNSNFILLSSLGQVETYYFSEQDQVNRVRRITAYQCGVNGDVNIQPQTTELLSVEC
jgi:leucyl-tRNA synthetase